MLIERENIYFASVGSVLTKNHGDLSGVEWIGEYEGFYYGLSEENPFGSLDHTVDHFKYNEVYSGDRIGFGEWYLGIKLGISVMNYSNNLGVVDSRGWLYPQELHGRCRVFHSGRSLGSVEGEKGRPDLFEKFGSKTLGWTYNNTAYQVGDDLESSVEFCFVDSEGNVSSKIYTKKIDTNATTVEEEIKLFLNSEEPYVLALGTIEHRKNHRLLYQVWKLLLDDVEFKSRVPNLVIVGRVGWLVKDLLYFMLHDPELREKVFVFSNVNDVYLNQLVDRSEFTVFPSFYEGWGLPVAESLARGKFCIASQKTSVPEIAGDRVEYFDPFDPVECASLVKKYITNQVELAERETEISLSYKNTPWVESARQIVEALERNQ